MISIELLDIQADLQHVRAQVCKAVRQDAPMAELHALLIAEENCIRRFRAAAIELGYKDENPCTIKEALKRLLEEDLG